MGRCRVYIKPFDDSGEYVTDWIDVSEDVETNGLGSIAADLDNTEYDIGVYRFSNVSLKLNNKDGKYSDVGTERTIFKFTRSNSLCKITWSIRESAPICGLAVCGEATLGGEEIVFTGLLNDESLEMDLDSHKAQFSVLGRESSFLKAVVPFGSISNGDLFSEVIYALLNQASITRLLTVSPASISVGLDIAIDSIASLQNKTVQEGLNKLLLASNSVLYIDGDAVIVTPRTPTVDVQKTFYGQGALNGVEDVQTIKKIKSGVSRAFNYFVFKDNTTPVQSDSSITKYGIRKKELDFEFVTDSGKQSQIMAALLAEFAEPKTEFDLYTQITYPVIGLSLLDRVAVDYPPVPFSETVLPIFGTAVAGDAITPYATWAFSLIPEDGYKIIGKSIDAKTSMVKLRLRAV